MRESGLARLEVQPTPLEAIDLLFYRLRSLLLPFLVTLDLLRVTESLFYIKILSPVSPNSRTNPTFLERRHLAPSVGRGIVSAIDDLVFFLSLSLSITMLPRKVLRVILNPEVEEEQLIIH
ncbi:hypothetical protein ACLOJK_013937 [Asimina triloba]